MNGGPNTPALDGRFTRPMVAGNQQQNAVSAGDRLLESAVDCGPRAVQIHPVEIEHAVGLDRTAPQLLVPAAIERLVSDRHSLGRSEFGGRQQCSLREL